MELSPELLQALHELYPPQDSIDALDFDCVQYINLRFPTEQSLSALEPVQAEIKEEATKARREMETLLREQALAGDEMRTLLGESRGTVAALRTHVGRMKEKAVDSERLVQEICADIRALDIAKKNLTLTITALKRLAMLTTALQQLEAAVQAKQYRQSVSLLEATRTLLEHFQDIQSPRVAALQAQREKLCTALRTQLLQDFRALKDLSAEQVADACLVADELGPEVRNEVVHFVAGGYLESYSKLFLPEHEHSGFDQVDRRYAWLKRTLRELQPNFSQFPEHWTMTVAFIKDFCELTKQHIMFLLDRDTSDSAALVTALQKTIQFEQEVTRKHGGTTKFQSAISVVFAPYMLVYSKSEEQSIKDAINQFLAESSVPDADDLILASNMKLFNTLKQKFTKCSNISTGQTLYELAQAFKRSLAYYAEVLGARLPKQPKVSDEELKSAAFLVNTAEHCRESIGHMDESFREKLEPGFEIDFYDEQALFLNLGGRALQCLVASLGARLDPAFAVMAKSNWQLESVGDKSPYVSEVTQVLLGSGLKEILRPEYFTTFLNKTAEMCSTKFVEAMFKCKRISDYGAQQMHLDCFEVKTRLTSMALDRPAAAMVGGTFKRVEDLLKVLSSPPERMDQMYSSFLQEHSAPADFDKVLQLRGLKRADLGGESKLKKFLNF